MRLPALMLASLIGCGLSGCMFHSQDLCRFQARIVLPTSDEVTRITIIKPVKNPDQAESPSSRSFVIEDREAIARVREFLADHTAIAGPSIRTISSVPQFTIDIEAVDKEPFHYEVGYDWMKVKVGSSSSLVKLNLLEMRRFCRLLETTPSKEVLP